MGRFLKERDVFMKVIVCKDYDEMSIKAAEFIAEEMNKKKNFVLGLATGSTPVGTYKNLIRMNTNKEIDFSDVVTFNLDEYIGLDKNHDQSFAYFMYENLFNHINIVNTNAHIPSGTETDYDAYCQEYEAMIERAGGIDLQLLGIGSNGHIGFNEPADEFSDITHTVDLTESTIKDNSRFFNSIDEVPKRAVTMGIGSILRAKKILMIVSGKNKAKAVYEAIHGPVDPKMPASALQKHSDVTVIVDEDAATYLKK